MSSTNSVHSTRRRARNRVNIEDDSSSVVSNGQNGVDHSFSSNQNGFVNGDNSEPAAHDDEEQANEEVPIVDEVEQEIFADDDEQPDEEEDGEELFGDNMERYMLKKFLKWLG